MSERKEKTMLKWLKQKPTHGHGGLPIEKITDDPLATIQVHPHAKKSKNKANEIYAVSRVNPLFEEEDVKEVFTPSGNSGSSGYDSGSGPSDDDFPIINVTGDLKDLQANLLGRLSSPPTVAATAITSKHPHLFINTENDVIHHETAIVGPNGRPILQILEQNPTYVKSIALSVANNGRKRPLSPISESALQHNNAPVLAQSTESRSNKAIHSPPTLSKYNLSTSGSLYNKDAKHTTSTNANNNSNYGTSDSIGSAKLIKKDSQYVRSIRIGGPTNFVNSAGTKRSILEANRRFSSSSTSSSSHGTPSRRPSVTFADDVGATSSSRPGSRKPSMEQDSIVTESLLMMTSVGAGRFSNASNNSSAANSRKTSFSSSQSRSQDESSNATETEIVSSEQDTVDLEAFANSLRKSRPIKQMASSTNGGKNARSHGKNDELDDTSSSSSNANPIDDFDPGSPPNERRTATLDRPTSASATSPTPRIHTNKSHKSPFGGIADHYAAAKEIAKEIESYSNGSAKASTKKSLVRDLLYRGNRSTPSSVPTNDNINAIKVVPSSSSNTNSNRDTGYGTHNGKNGFRTSRVGGGGTSNGREGTMPKDSRHQPSSSNPQLKHEQHVLLAARAASPIYYGESPYGITSARNGSSSSHRRGTGTVANNNALYSSSPQDAGTATLSGGSTDWELVRVQQVYVKAGSSSQDQQTQQHTQKKQRKSGKEGDLSTMPPHHTTTSSSNTRDRDTRAVVHQGQDHTSNIPIPTTSSGTTNSRRHPSSSITASTSKSTSSARGKAAKKVPSADDGLASGARSRVQNDGTDSGNSSERAYTEVRLEIEGTKIELSGENVSDTTIQVEDDSTRPENLPSKVMIVTGDSQNIVVDLSGVPLDLKNAIVSGTALITLPDGLDKMLQPGYTMITIPATNTTRPMSPMHSQLVGEGDVSTVGPAGPLRTNKLSKDGVMNIAIGLDDNKPLVTSGGSSGNSSDDECKLFATKNKAQIWDVMQQTVGKQHDGGGGGKGKKKITTIFPFHPNQDAYESPDFTIEGHRLDRQRKKVELEKRRRCACRLCGMLFFLVAFLGVLVALSMIYTRGQRYFGSV